MTPTALESMPLVSSPVAVPYPVSRNYADPSHDDAAGAPGRWRAVLVDVVGLFAVVWSIPLAVLLVGTPIVLTVVLMLWLGRLALGAF